MFLSLYMIFGIERTAVVWAILERISGFDPSLEMIDPRYLKVKGSERKGLGPAFHTQCLRHDGALTPIAPTAIRLREPLSFIFLVEVLHWL